MFKITKSLVGRLCTAALLMASTIDGQVYHDEFIPQLRDPQRRPAGIGLRLQQKTVNQLKSAMQKFLPHYITYDLGINKKKEEWDMGLLFGLLKYHIEFSDIHYAEPTLDLRDTRILFTDLFDRPMLKVHFPAL